MKTLASIVALPTSLQGKRSIEEAGKGFQGEEINKISWNFPCFFKENVIGKGLFLYNNVNQLDVCIYPLPGEPPSHTHPFPPGGHHRALS